MNDKVCTLCEINIQKPYDEKDVESWLKTFSLTLDKVKKQIDTDKQKYRTLCTQCRAYALAFDYYFFKIENKSFNYFDLVNFQIGLITNIWSLTERQVWNVLQENSSTPLWLKIIKIAFKIHVPKQGNKTSEEEQKYIRLLREEPGLSIREISYVSGRSKSTIHHVLTNK